MNGSGGLIPLDEAQARLFALARPKPPVEIALVQACGHVLAQPLLATRNQPAADLSAMDGYAVSADDMPGPWTLIGESAAGRPFRRAVKRGDAVRISTGAIVPAGADTIVVQEDIRVDGTTVVLTGDGPATPGAHIRRAGHDFADGALLAPAGTCVDARVIALAAMAGHGTLSVHAPVRVVILSTGDELVAPGTPLPSPAHIPASNGVMLSAMLHRLPVDMNMPALLADRLDGIAAALADHRDADIIVTTGGASVGDHDLIQPALLESGGSVDFWRIAMRPGKPVMVGRLGNAIVLGLPGNPVSAYVTALLLLLPLVRTFAGYQEVLPHIRQAAASVPFSANGARQDFMRARLTDSGLVPVSSQDSGALSSLLAADALVIRAAHQPETLAGEPLDYIALG
ncbi:molybdopterin molybdotransferase MoeA [Blastomonas aquatica]|uniref:Molybdopterin molybdenumtransferase n=1 Tax=Blastomonas aquatica TaxID=1510276 RepID=A0ABQ1J7M5_9SPHN|nr:molybdopterin molybdotransferase MoeA [Blastomonas aquatica]GGB60713.1 molybdopterin molybdenumtransferase MoeA [Blastomonas aquatica]